VDGTCFTELLYHWDWQGISLLGIRDINMSQLLHELHQYLKECDTLLLNTEYRKNINYNIDNISEWHMSSNQSCGQTLKQNNENMLPKNNANVYAIYVNQELVYIGQTKSSLSTTRLTNHLFYKHEKTGSKLAKVKESIKESKTISISYISVEPESLRHYIEDELIKKYTLTNTLWNIQGK
jgi:hypothetical protein